MTVPPRMDETLAAETNPVPPLPEQELLRSERFTAESFTNYNITFRDPGQVIMICSRCEPKKRVNVRGKDLLEILQMAIAHDKEDHK